MSEEFSIIKLFRRILCKFNLHKNISITVGNFIRCYDCGMDMHPRVGWISHERMLEKLSIEKPRH